MKLASLNQGRDGVLIVVSRDLTRAVLAPQIAITLQAALDDWAVARPKLEAVYQRLNDGLEEGAFAFDQAACHSPLPRAYHWADGSAYVNHVELVRKARGAEMPESFWHDPLMYQGGADAFIPPHSPIRLADEAWGIDLEAELAVITDDVPMGATPAEAAGHIRLLMLVNDVSLRNLIPGELAKGFGFYQSKPSSSMTFNFPTLVAHAAKTRPLGAGTVIGSGTVSNYDRSAGSSCLAEKRMLEIVEQGEAKTPFLKFGDRVRIEMFDAAGQSVFGAIDQVVEKYDAR
ncbi:MAG: 2-keto-4-pentenoate hydratase [Gammaproteobacteria bacterium HGW-Gammaproteobacteria-12]|nr:MAG: 2-keto-4-pentenoate hydratase [Gammaproteobacteria bacterium HGW-Gammaproteobacteria-12]